MGLGSKRREELILLPHISFRFGSAKGENQRSAHALPDNSHSLDMTIRFLGLVVFAYLIYSKPPVGFEPEIYRLFAFAY